MSKNKIEKPENMADGKTYKVMPLIEPPLEGGDIFIDGVPIEEAIKANSDSNAPPDDDSDSYVQEYPDHFIFTNKKTGKETKVDK